MMGTMVMMTVSKGMMAVSKGVMTVSKGMMTVSKGMMTVVSSGDGDSDIEELMIIVFFGMINICSLLHARRFL